MWMIREQAAKVLGYITEVGKYKYFWDGLGSSVVIASDYGLDDPGSKVCL